MIALALLLSASAYDRLPSRDPVGVAQCRRAYDDLTNFVSTFNGIVWRRDLDRGGRLTWRQANKIRYTADTVARSYQDRIRRIAWQGRGRECREIAHEGRQAVIEQVIRPIFGNE